MLINEIIFSESSNLIFHQNNPGGQWLSDEKENNNHRNKNAYGAPSRFGPVTGYFNRKILLPVSIISKFKGVMGEQNYTREKSLQYLKKEMEETNTLPKLDNTNNLYCPFIMVDQNGLPWINEGNHRIKAAKILNWKFILVDLKYFTGGEEINGLVSVDIVKKYDSEGISLGYKANDDFIGILK
jgi:hypothetical protein